MLLAELEDLDDVRMGDERGEACLFEEHLHEHGIRREMTKETLDDDGLREARGPLLPREEHLPHAARRKELLEVVLAEHRTPSLATSQ